MLEKFSIREAIQEIKKVEPENAALFENETTLIETYRKLVSHTFHLTHLERQKPYKDLISKKVSSLFGKEDIRINFGEGLIVNTSDHHGIFNFPPFVSAHLLRGLGTILEREKYGDYFSLNAGNIPLNDISHRRGLHFSQKHINLFPKQDKNKLVSRYPVYKFNMRERAAKSNEKFSESELLQLDKFQELINSVDFSNCSKLSDQISKINYHLWQHFFVANLRDKVRKCITLEHDEILSEFLCGFLKDKNTPLWRALFDPEVRDLVVERFHGIYGAWNYAGQGTGTFFFWGFNQQEGREFRYELQDGRLTNPQGKVEDVELNPDMVIAQLRNGLLIPSIFTKFAVFTFYLGAKALGGPGQVAYLSRMKKTWKEVLLEIDPDEVALLDTVDTTNSVMLELFFRRNSNKLCRDWGLDLAYLDNITLEYLENVKNVKARHGIMPLLREYYWKVTVPANRKTLDFNDQELYQGFSWVR